MLRQDKVSAERTEARRGASPGLGEVESSDLSDEVIGRIKLGSKRGCLLRQSATTACRRHSHRGLRAGIELDMVYEIALLCCNTHTYVHIQISILGF